MFVRNKKVRFLTIHKSFILKSYERTLKGTNVVPPKNSYFFLFFKKKTQKNVRSYVFPADIGRSSRFREAIVLCVYSYLFSYERTARSYVRTVSVRTHDRTNVPFYRTFVPFLNARKIFTFRPHIVHISHISKQYVRTVPKRYARTFRLCSYERTFSP